MSNPGLFGVAVYLTPAADPGKIYWASDIATPSQPSLFIGCRPLTPLEQAGKDARLAVRRGLADVLAWLGQTVENEPTGEEVYERLKREANRQIIAEPLIACKPRRSAHDMPSFWISEAR